MVVRVYARAVSVAPVNADGVTSNWFRIQHLKRWLKHGKRVIGFGLPGRGPVGASAGGARTLIAQIDQTVSARMAVFPIYGYTFRLGYGDMFGVAGKAAVWHGKNAGLARVPFHVAHAGDAAHGTYQTLELFLVAYVYRHFDSRAVLVQVRFCLEIADVGVLVDEGAGEAIE